MNASFWSKHRLGATIDFWKGQTNGLFQLAVQLVECLKLS